MICKYCNSSHVHKDGNHNGFQRYKCLSCGKRFDGEAYTSKNEYFIHFNAKLKKTNRNLLTRENYCIPSNELWSEDKKQIQDVKKHIEENGEPPLWITPSWYKFPNEVFVDENHYTTDYVENCYQNCMKNYDLNMQYFDNINFDEFNTYLLKFAKKNRFTEITDLSDVSSKTGVYILVLDKYKQAYIGISKTDIKKRILTHWNEKKHFRQLIHQGDVEKSVLSIDVFGALDTTRIFYKELPWYKDIDRYEDKLVKDFKQEYNLNRVPGGLNGYLDPLERSLLLSSAHKRQLG